jgi:hypothetical protein
MRKRDAAGRTGATSCPERSGLYSLLFISMPTLMDQLAGPCIVTRYLGPTNTRPSRVVATHKRDNETTWRKVLAWDHSMNSAENHQAAANALLADWPYETTLRIVARGHDHDAYFWVCVVE